jgi:hypothetical protein
VTPIARLPAYRRQRLSTRRAGASGANMSSIPYRPTIILSEQVPTQVRVSAVKS